MTSRDPFEDLFVLEMTNNHLGDLERGKQIIQQHSTVVRNNEVRAAIKVQFRSIPSFIHDDFVGRVDIPYIRRISETAMPFAAYAALVQYTRDCGCIPMATPFDEDSIKWCLDLDIPIIKVASVDSNDWSLLSKIAQTRRPVIVSTGGLGLHDLDDLVSYFASIGVPLAINHCVCSYPTEDHELDLNQIDFLRDRYPRNTIGLSTHEHHDWSMSMAISYAKGARLFERHIDVVLSGEKIAPYSSLPGQIDTWFKAFRKAKEMCGGPKDRHRDPLQTELEYISSHTRGVYARETLAAGTTLTEQDIYFAFPLHQGQLSSREIRLSRETAIMVRDCDKDRPILIDMVNPYAQDEDLVQQIRTRGLS